MLNICFVAGKSGGHLLPCITKAEQIKKENPQVELYIFTSGSDLDKTVLKKYDHIQAYTPTTLDNPPYDQPWMLPWFALKTGWYFLKSLYFLYKTKPSKVISFGGFIAIPVVLAAKILQIPVELYELNVQPGRATKLLSMFENRIYTCFNQTKQYFPNKICIHFDYPVRFNCKDLIFNKKAFLDQHDFSPNKFTILILGGSQGSILLNQTIKNLLEKEPLWRQKLQIIHQTGHSDPFDYKNFYDQLQVPSIVFDYHDRLQDYYNAADLIVCRAGAGTLFEIKFFGKPCISIPHQTNQTNHQIENVLALQQEFPDQFSIIKQDFFDFKALNQALHKLN
jgi:UDP-N-acetylglucosamine--N-acetylmuramyl-(pentapeptide) pyrophosphoryl-undecaprenol N-acetylglucosamine transferase